MVSIYDYTNYRRFLKDRFFEIKSKNPAFSFRSFNRIAGVQSSGFLKLVWDKKRNLAEDGIQKIARGFKLNESERRYFELLVKLNQSKNHEEKDLYFKQLSRQKKFIEAKPLTAAQYQLFSHWYYVAILELIRAETKTIKTPEWIRNHLKPDLKLKEVKDALEHLQQLGLIDINRQKNYVRVDTMLKTDDEVQNIAVVNYHIDMSNMAIRSVLNDTGEEREFSGLTILTSEKSFEKAKQEIQRFRKKLHSILEQESDGPKTVVSQMNFQLFKLSKPV